MILMQKIEFKNLPDETTPINSENLNTMQDNIEQYINLKDSDISKKINGEESMGSIVVEDIKSKNLYNPMLVTINNNNYYYEFEIDNTKPYVFQSPYDYTLVYGIDASGNETRPVYETGKTQDSRVVTFVPNSNEAKIKCAFYTENFQGFNGVQLEQNDVATNYNKYINFNGIQYKYINSYAMEKNKVYEISEKLTNFKFLLLCLSLGTNGTSVLQPISNLYTFPFVELRCYETSTSFTEIIVDIGINLTGNKISCNRSGYKASSTSDFGNNPYTVNVYGIY